jgi:multiple sugar transport system permease protein
MGSRLLRYLALSVLILVFWFPLLWMLSYSLRPIGLPPPTKPEFFVPPLAFENYWRVNDYMAITPLMVNSLRIAGIAVPLTLLTASWAGLAIAQLPRAARAFLLALSVALMLVPAVSTWVPRFIFFTNLGWVDTILPLLAPAVMGTSPFYVILFYVSFARIPSELYDAARLDGANALQVWYLVALPLARAAVIAVAVLSFAVYWSSYVEPFLYLQSEAHYTFPVAVRLLEQAHPSNFPVLMAASVIMVAPVILLFAFAQRYFLQGSDALAQFLGRGGDAFE